MITFILFTTVVYEGDGRDVYLGMNIITRCSHCFSCQRKGYYKVLFPFISNSFSDVSQSHTVIHSRFHFTVFFQKKGFFFCLCIFFSILVLLRYRQTNLTNLGLPQQLLMSCLYRWVFLFRFHTLYLCPKEKKKQINKCNNLPPVLLVIACEVLG